MTQETELQKLERFVEKLLEKFSALKSQHLQLQEELKEKEEQILRLEGDISTNDNERTEISQRVNKLVEQIEEWEMGLDDDADAESMSSEDEFDYEEEESVEDETDAADEEGRVQHNLFSMSGSEEETEK